MGGQKPAVPYVGFPLFPHASGRWAKKIRQKMHFFGRWAHTVNGELTQVDDVAASAVEAKKELDRQWPYLTQGRAAPAEQVAGATVLQIVNAFLTAQAKRVEKKTLSPRTYARYKRAAEQVVEQFGKGRSVETLCKKDFDDLLEEISVGQNPTSIGNDIRHVRILFNYAVEEELIAKAISFGKDFKVPAKAVVRRAEQAARREHGKRMLEAEHLRAMIYHLGESEKRSDIALRAMILLGVNCGFGQTDVANLEQSHIEPNGEWVDFPRPKTAVERRVPLWPETAMALRIAAKVRPEPKSDADRKCFFITRCGRRWVTVTPQGCVTDTVGACFSRLLVAMGLKRKGLNFYALRHVTETIGGNSLDQVAVDAIMGHASEEMAAKYREEIFETRLRSVTDTIRNWLFKGRS